MKNYHIKTLVLCTIFHYVSAFSSDLKSLTIATYNLENFWDASPHNTDNNWFEYTLTLPRYRVVVVADIT